MATHPVEPEPQPGRTPGTGAPNPTHLPVEPEFGDGMPDSDADNPQPAQPPL